MGKLYFTCSFDDGDVADLRLAGMLWKYGIKGTFYIPQSCNLVSKSLTNNQISELSYGFEIGGHTMSHQILTAASNEAARTEINECKQWLEDVIGKSVHSFCPPTGRFNKEHVAMVKQAGYKTMRTVEMLSSMFPQNAREEDFVVLPTTTQMYNHKRLAYVKNGIKRWNIGGFLLLSKFYDTKWERMSKNYFTHLNQVAAGSHQDLFFHVWGHSWEIEKFGLWQSLDVFLKELTTFEGVVFCNNTELAKAIKHI